MTKNDVDRGMGRSKDAIYSIVFIVSVVLSLSVGGFLYWYYWLRTDYSAVYATLGISALPLSAQIDPKVSTRLDQLRREPCSAVAIVGLADALLAAGYPRDTDTSLMTFGKRCGESNETHRRRHQALTQASDFSAALRIADDLVHTDPASATYRYMRGQTYEKMKEFEPALADYLSSAQLTGAPSRVSASLYYDISRMFAELGRFCDGITPIETWVSFNPVARGSTKTAAMIAEYSSKGNCGVSHAQGSAKVPLNNATGVQLLSVAVNGVTGNFLIDTGASYLSVTGAFSSKSKITGTGIKLPMKTVGGMVLAELGNATSISVGSAQARNVAVAVIGAERDPFGSRIDGLLGMSFLARFNVKLLPNSLELTPVDLKVR